MGAKKDTPQVVFVERPSRDPCISIPPREPEPVDFDPAAPPNAMGFIQVPVTGDTRSLALKYLSLPEGGWREAFLLRITDPAQQAEVAKWARHFEAYGGAT